MTHHEPVLAPVYPSIGFESLGRLLRRNGYAIEPIADAARPGYRVLGGVTEYHLRDQFWYWCKTLERVVESVRRCLVDSRGHTIH